MTTTLNPTQWINADDAKLLAGYVFAERLGVKRIGNLIKTNLLKKVSMFSPVYCMTILSIWILTFSCFAEDITSSVPDPADNFSISFAKSFNYDQCGTPELGAIMRKALTEKIERCSIPVASLNKFRKLTSQSSTAFPLDPSKWEKSPFMPTKTSKEDCNVLLNSKAGIQLKNNLIKFGEGEISAEDTIALSCTTSDPSKGSL